MVVVLVLASYPISQAKAAKTGITTIDFGKVYKNYDLDGDGKKDSLKVVATYPKGNEHETGYLTIYIIRRYLDKQDNMVRIGL